MTKVECKKYFLLVFLLLFYPVALKALHNCSHDINVTDTLSSIVEKEDTCLTSDSITAIQKDSAIYALPFKKNLWRGVGEGVFVNAFVWSADRWLLGKDYYSKGWPTLKKNLEEGWSFDSDAFPTNFIDHPYHGNLYFTGARTSGCNFWLSSLLTAIGSIEWEEVAETDYPSPNDLFSTTFGGAAIGEVAVRMTNIILNNKKRGFNRVLREVTSFGLAPMRGLNRMVDGDSWRHDESHYLYHDKQEIPYRIRFSTGGRWADTNRSSTRCNANVTILIDYGNWGSVRHNKPYDCFRSTMTFNKMGTHVPLVSEFCINGRLFGWQLSETENHTSVFSINQDFTYYNNEQQERFKGDVKTLLNLTESAALGPAYTLTTKPTTHMFTSNLVFMGGYTSDYYYRNYNMGSGFNIKTYNELRVSKIVSLNLDASFHYLFTWKGYEKDQVRHFDSQGLQQPYIFNFKKGRKGGDKSYATFIVFAPRLDLKLFSNIYASAQWKFFVRNSIYKYHKNVRTNYSDLQLSLTFLVD